MGKSRHWRKTGKSPLPMHTQQISCRAPDCTVQMGLTHSLLQVSPSTWSTNMSANAVMSLSNRDHNPSDPTGGLGGLAAEQRSCAAASSHACARSPLWARCRAALACPAFLGQVRLLQHCVTLAFLGWSSCSSSLPPFLPVQHCWTPGKETRRFLLAAVALPWC